MIRPMILKKSRMDQSRPIRESAADLLQQAILAGQYVPGQEIPQLGLSRQLGLSQSSVREALQELENRGLIMKNGRNWTVTQLSRDDLSDLYQVRSALEPLACKLAACTWRDEHTKALEDALEAMLKSARDRDYPRHSEADRRFHQIIWEAQPNRALLKQLNLLCMPLFAYDLVARSGCAYLDFNRSARQHRTIIQVLATRDGGRAEKVVRRLIERFHRQDVRDFDELGERSRDLRA